MFKEEKIQSEKLPGGGTGWSEQLWRAIQGWQGKEKPVFWSEPETNDWERMQLHSEHRNGINSIWGQA